MMVCDFVRNQWKLPVLLCSDMEPGQVSSIQVSANYEEPRLAECAGCKVTEEISFRRYRETD